MEEDKDTESLAGFFDGELGNSGRSDKLVSHKRRNFFKRKVKDQGSSPLKNEETSQSSNKIVILKPGPTLKRRLKTAIGKEISPRIPSEPQNLSEHDGSFRESSGRSSLTKEHFFVERIARVKKGEKTDKLKGQVIGRDYNSMPHPIVSNIYVEAKKHLSEMLSNGDDEEQCPNEIFASEQNFENVIEYAESSVKQDDIVNPASQTRENLEPQSHVSNETNGIEVQTGDLSRNITDENNDCDVARGDVQIVEVTEIVVEEESSAFDAHSEKSGASSLYLGIIHETITKVHALSMAMLFAMVSDYCYCCCSSIYGDALSHGMRSSRQELSRSSRATGAQKVKCEVGAHEQAGAGNHGSKSKRKYLEW
ncbi:hypothetical protein ACFE04_009951 [Oxalis oulophora]